MKKEPQPTGMSMPTDRTAGGMKTILVTGGGRGLGRGVAERLAADGHRVVLTVRDSSGPLVVADILRKTPSAKVEHRTLDLASFASIRSFARDLPHDLRFDVVLHVAGILQQSPVRRTTSDGFEETLAVNTLAPFLLTHELLPRIGTDQGPGRVICVSSRLHLPGSRGVPVDYDFSDPNLERGYHPDRAYKGSKLALLWFAFELARRIPPSQFTVHGMCPGFVPETAAASTKGLMRLFMRFVLPHMPFATRLLDAIDAIRFVAVDPSLDASTGGFWAEKKPFEPSRQSRSLEDGKRFWEWAESVTGTGPWPANANANANAPP